MSICYSPLGFIKVSTVCLPKFRHIQVFKNMKLLQIECTYISLFIIKDEYVHAFIFSSTGDLYLEIKRNVSVYFVHADPGI